MVWVLLGLPIACDMSVDPNRGWLEVTGNMEEGQGITIPLEATAGAPFDVEFNTGGTDAACYRPTRPRIMQTATRADIEPRVFINVNDGVVCDDIYIPYTHRATLRFDQPGVATVVIKGLRGSVRARDTLIFERTVLIR
jgi:hypothetical protein